MNTISYLPFANGFPKISIVTPSYNQGDFLEECIDSILSQNYPNLEYIIMDGGSSDKSVAIIKKYERFLTYWQSKPDGGQYQGIHDGFARTSGEIMAWLNSDDKYHCHALWKIAYLFSQRSEVEWVTGRHSFWAKNGEFIDILNGDIPEFTQRSYLNKKYIETSIQQESTFWRRSLWERAGSRLSADLEYAGDLELWVRFFRYAPLYRVEQLLGGYRLHGNQKAVLHQDLYLKEADSVIAQERDFLSAVQLVSLTFDPIVLSPEKYQSWLFDSGGNEALGNGWGEPDEYIEFILVQAQKRQRGRLLRLRRALKVLFFYFFISIGKERYIAPIFSRYNQWRMKMLIAAANKMDNN